jgi:uncharacterized membrane protein YdbT with pleckstrin-like domain
MERSFNPHPIVAVTKVIIMAALLSILLYVMKDVVERIFSTLLLSLWLVAFVFVTISLIAARFHTLTLEENTIAYNSGILSLRRIVLPYAKITEASYTQSLIQRIFGVGSLNIDTAGGDSVAIRIHDIRYGHLKTILDEINAKGGKDSGI